MNKKFKNWRYEIIFIISYSFQILNSVWKRFAWTHKKTKYFASVVPRRFQRGQSWTLPWAVTGQERTNRTRLVFCMFMRIKAQFLKMKFRIEKGVIGRVIWRRVKAGNCWQFISHLATVNSGLKYKPVKLMLSDKCRGFTD